MGKSWLIWASIIIGLVFFGYILGKFPLSDLIEPFENASLLSILFFILVSFLITLNNTLKWHLVNKAMGIKIGFWELYKYRLAGYSVSYVTPGPRVGGEPTMAALMKKKGVEYVQSISAMVIDKSIEVSTSGLLFIIGVLVVLIGFALPQNIRVFMIVAAVVFGIIIGFFYYRMLNGNNFFLKIIRVLRLDTFKFVKKYEQKLILFESLILRFYNKERTAYFIILFFTILGWVLMYFEYSAALAILGEHASIIGIFLMVSFVGAALILPIPMAIGSLEAGQITAFSIVGLKSSLGVTLAFLIRARDFLLIFAGFLLLVYYGFDVKKQLQKVFRKSVTIKKNVKVPLR
ncbi:UPF0104 family protein [Candidatus Woesearchaeota archaeon]|nr:MAG: UPF0104 family protein [Candidatus Woesearchaeota archaeon]